MNQLSALIVLVTLILLILTSVSRADDDSCDAQTAGLSLSSLHNKLVKLEEKIAALEESLQSTLKKFNSLNEKKIKMDIQ